MKKKFSIAVVTANHLLSGLSVYLTREGEWAESIGEARVAGGEAETLALQALAKADEAANKVVGVYVVPVTVDADGAPVPVHYRERMRARAYPSFWRESRSPAVKEAARVSI